MAYRTLWSLGIIAVIGLLGSKRIYVKTSDDNHQTLSVKTIYWNQPKPARIEIAQYEIFAKLKKVKANVWWLCNEGDDHIDIELHLF